MPTLKEEWIERIKKIRQRNIFPKEGGMFTVKTDFYEAPDEIRYDKEMCFKVLLESDDCIWNVPEEIRTNEFLEEIAEKGYKGNILLSRKEWKEEDFDFLKKYLSRFEKGMKPYFDSWVTFNPSGVFANRDMLLSLVKDGEMRDEKFLLKKYGKDKEMMFAFVDSDPKNIGSIPKGFRSEYLKNKNKMLEVLQSSKSSYKYLSKKMKLNNQIIDIVLSDAPHLFNDIDEEIINDREKAFELIKKYPGIKGSYLCGRYKDDYEIAKFMTGREGSNIIYFEFTKNKEMLELAAETYNNVSHISSSEENEELIRRIILKSDKHENDVNLSFSKGNGKKTVMVRDLFPELLKKGNVYLSTIGDFFEQYRYNEKNDLETNYDIYRDIFVKCMNIEPHLYEKVTKEYKENDIEMLYDYVQLCIMKNKEKEKKEYLYKNYIPEEIKNKANEEKIEVEKYIFNMYLNLKIKPAQKQKMKKLKI